MTKYCVTVVQTGCVFVEAESEEEAVDIAAHQFGNSVYWDDVWEATDVIEDDGALPEMYIHDRAF